MYISLIILVNHGHNSCPLLFVNAFDPIALKYSKLKY